MDCLLAPLKPTGAKASVVLPACPNSASDRVVNWKENFMVWYVLLREKINLRSQKLSFQEILFERKVVGFPMNDNEQ